MMSRIKFKMKMDQRKHYLLTEKITKIFMGQDKRTELILLTPDFIIPKNHRVFSAHLNIHHDVIIRRVE